MYYPVADNRNLINHFYPVNITDDEVLDIVDYYKYYDIKPIKDIIDDKLNKLCIGDVLLIARMCAIKAVIDYVDNNENIPNNEIVFDLMSRFIDNNTLLIFGDACREEYELYHFSTDDIADIIIDIKGYEEEQNEI